MTGDADLVRRLLGEAHSRWIVERVRDRVEKGLPLPATLTLRAPTPPQRDAVERLLGRAPRSGAALNVRLADLDAVLRNSGAAPDTVTAVELLLGPLRDRRAEDARAAEAWDAVSTALEQLVARHPALAEFRTQVRATGLLRRLADGPGAAGSLVAQLATVVDALPAPDEPLPEFASRVVGDAHGLDEGRPLATLALGAAAALAGSPRGSGAAWRREVWAAVGVLVADLSAPVLVLGLPGGPGVTGQVLSACGTVGEPVHLTLRQLVRHPLPLPPPSTVVSVCENPSVVAAAADRLGAASRPLVCAGGRPGGAVRALLRQLVQAGTPLRYHGDFDWGGIGIANGMLTDFGAEPWRYDVEDYRAAVPASTSPLTGRPVEASWSPELRGALLGHGLRVEEELVLDDLVGDLRSVT